MMVVTFDSVKERNTVAGIHSADRVTSIQRKKVTSLGFEARLAGNLVGMRDRAVKDGVNDDRIQDPNYS